MVRAYQLGIYLLLTIAAMLVMLEVGYRLAIHRGAPGPAPGAVEASIFGLMGLLLAFTFYGAGSRFEARRDLIVQEANAISTAYRRLDLLPPEARPPLKEAFRQYVHSRLATYQKINDPEGIKAELAGTASLQNEIWRTAVEAARPMPTASAMILLIPSLNQMFDIQTAQTVALEAHPPYAVFILLVLTVLVASLLAGYGLSFDGGRNWLYRASYIVVLTATLSLIADYEYPRLGLLSVGYFDKVIAHTLDIMK
jgi:hypothetical protein